jgi:hypothetical protein
MPHIGHGSEPLLSDPRAFSPFTELAGKLRCLRHASALNPAPAAALVPGDTPSSAEMSNFIPVHIHAQTEILSHVLSTLAGIRVQSIGWEIRSHTLGRPRFH